MCEQDQQKRRGEIHAELMAISRGLNAIHPSRQPEEARRLLSRRRELQAEYQGLVAK
jgi:hypothetical protein